MSLNLKKIVAGAGLTAFGAAAFFATHGANATSAGGYPFFLDPFGGGVVNFVTQPGVPVSQFIWVSDFDLPNGDFLTLTWDGNPPGATTTPPCPIVGAPGADVTTLWQWTPTLADVGLHETFFVVIDSDGQFQKADLKIEVEPPFAVELGSFGVSQNTAGGPAYIRWSTLSEIDNAYFNVYRGSSVIFEQSAKMNGAPVMATGTPFEGVEYERADLRVKPGTAYRYWLEAVDIFGGTELFGPVTLYAR